MMRCPRLGPLVSLLVLIASVAAADFLEVRCPATVKEDHNRDARVINRYDAGAELPLLADEKTDGYYRVTDVRTGRPGWIYKTFVRRHEGTASSAGQPPSGEEADDTASLIEERLGLVRTQAYPVFGEAPASDATAVPAGVLALVSWNIQTGGTSPSPGAERPRQVETALAQMCGGTFQVLAAQEIASTAHARKLRQMLPGGETVWTASLTDTTSSMDNGFWFRSGATHRGDVALFATTEVEPSGRVVTDDSRALRPPRLAHVTVGDFDFTLITLHLTFQDSDTRESAREFRVVLDFLDAYFDTPGHDPDVVICGNFNTPSALSGTTGNDCITLDSIIAADSRFCQGERRLVVLVHEPTSRRPDGTPANNYDHFVLSADCMEELITARRMDTRILHDRSGEVQPDGSRRRTSDHFPAVAFFRTTGPHVHRDGH